MRHYTLFFFLLSLNSDMDLTLRIYLIWTSQIPSANGYRIGQHSCRPLLLKVWSLDCQYCITGSLQEMYNISLQLDLENQYLHLTSPR